MGLVVITPVYNGANTLKNLYTSLCVQEFMEYKWLLINDGSKDDSEKVIKGFLDEQRLDIDYIVKSNGGKSSALNMAFERIEPDDFALIVDADEKLCPLATEIVTRYFKENKPEQKVGVIHFSRINEQTGQVISEPVFSEDQNMSYLQWIRRGYYADGYIGYFGYALQGKRFPIFEGEYYVGPSVLYMMVCREYEMIWSHEVLGTTFYGEGGITKQGRKLRIRNPYGMITYCISHQSKEAGLKLRLKYSMAGFAYQKIAGLSDVDLIHKNVDIKQLNPLMKPLGYLLAEVWKEK